MSKNTLIIVEQKATFHHHIEIQGELSDDQIDDIANGIDDCSELDEIYQAIDEMGCYIENYDRKGCWEGSELEYFDSRVVEEGD